MENLKNALEDGTVFYRNELGQYHRDGGPAIVCADGYEAYYINGKRHREGGPAILIGSRIITTRFVQLLNSHVLRVVLATPYSRAISVIVAPSFNLRSMNFKS